MDKAVIFLAKIAATMHDQFCKIAKYRLADVSKRDALNYRYFLFSKEMTNGSLLLDNTYLLKNMRTVIDESRKYGLPQKRGIYETIADTMQVVVYDSLMREKVTKPATPTGNRFLDYYNQTLAFDAGIKTVKSLARELNDVRESIAALNQIGKKYYDYLDTLRSRHASKLIDALRQTEQFDTLTNLTLLWLYAFKNGSNAVDSITIRDSAVMHMRKWAKKELEMTYDSIQVNDRKIASGPGVRRWITPQQFNEIMDDTLSRKAFLGLLYQRLSAVEGSLKYAPQNMALLATKIMNTIYQIDDTREILGYKKRTNQALGFEDYYPFIRATVDMLNIVLETPLQATGKPLSQRFSKLADVPDISNESLSLFENVFAENYANAIRNVVQLLSIIWGLQEKNDTIQTAKRKLSSQEKALKKKNKKNRSHVPTQKRKLSEKEKASKKENEEIKKENEKTRRKNEKIKSSILVYGSFMANMVGAQTPDQVKAAIRAVAVPPGSSSVKRNSRMNVDVNAYLGPGGFVEILNDRTIPNNKDKSLAIALSVPVGITASLGQMGAKERSFSLFFPVLDIGAVTSFRLSKNGVQSKLPELSFGNLISPGAYLLWNLKKSPFTWGVGAQFGPQLRKVTVDGIDKNSSAWRIGATFSIDVPIFNLYTRQEKPK